MKPPPKHYNTSWVLSQPGSTVEDLGTGHADTAQVDGLSYSRAPHPWEDPSTLSLNQNEVSGESTKVAISNDPVRLLKEVESDENGVRKKRKLEEKKKEKDMKHDKHERREKRQFHDSIDTRKHKKDKGKRRRHDSDSD